MRINMKYIILICLLISSSFGWTQTYSEINKIVASDRSEDARFGQAVAIEGNYAVVGAYGSDVSGPNRGQAYIYEYIAGNWTQTQILTNSDDENYDRFGWSVAINGDYIVIGATGEDDDLSGSNSMSKAGAAYIFQNQAGTWVQVQKIIANDRSIDDEFGWSVDISDSTLIVGAHQDFEDENNLNPIHHAGSVYIFDLDGSGTWSQSQKIVASGRAPDIVYPNGYTGEDLSDQFGHTVGISGNYLIVGALNHDWDVTNTSSSWQAGAAYIFERTGGVWTEVQKIRNSDNVAWDRFGSDVAIDTNFIAIGVWAEDESLTDTDYMKNSGSIYIFTRDAGGTWNENQKITAGTRNTGDHFGWDVKMDGDLLISGAEHDDHDENETNPLNETGSAYLFKKNGVGTYTQIQKIRGSDRDSLDVFGYAVDVSNNNAIAGAFQHDFNVLHADSINEAGAAYIFSTCSAPITHTQDSTICFGSSVTVGTSIYSNNGNYTDVFLTNQGCDSIVTTNLTVTAEININQTITICDGDSYLIGTSTYNSEGLYSDILTSMINGCDSTVNTTIVFYSPIVVNQSVSICPGESYTIGTSTYTSAGNYTDILTSIINGCDSTINTTISENSAFNISQNITICYGESYTIGTSTYTTPGNYTDTLNMIANSCDSIVHTNLTINLPIDISITATSNTLESNENGAFYQWLDCDNNYQSITSVVANEQEVTVIESGNYAVELYDNGCVDTSACVYVNYVALDENSNSNFNIYPNPSSGSFTVEFENTSIFPYSIIILNNLGEVVYNQIDINDIKHELNTLYLPKGIYLIEIKSSNSRLFQKLIIQ